MVKNLYQDFLLWYYKDYGSIKAKNEFTNGHTTIYILDKIDNNKWLITTSIYDDLHYLHLVLDHVNKTASIIAA